MARADLVEQALHDDHGCNASVAKMSRGAGYDNQLFRGEQVIASEGDRRPDWPDQLIVRIPTADREEAVQRVHDLRAIHGWCAEHHYPAVPILATGQLVDGTAYLVLPMIRGPQAVKHLTRPWRNRAAIGRLVDLQSQLHQLPTDGWPGPLRDAEMTLSELRRAAVSGSAATPIIDWLSANHPESSRPAYLRVGHFDFHPLNIVWPWGGEPTVLDWDAAALAPPAADLAATVELFACGDAFIAGRLTARLAGRFGRQLADRYARSYLAHHSIDEKELRWWRVVQCAQLLLWREGATIFGTAVRPEALATWSPNLERVVSRRFHTLTGLRYEDLTRPN